MTKKVLDLPHAASTIPWALSAGGTFESESALSGKGKGAAGVGEEMPSKDAWDVVKAVGSG